MKSDILNLIIGGSYIAIIVVFGIFMSWFTIQRRKNTEAMRKNINSKLNSNISLSSRDIVNIGKSYDLSASQSRKIIYKAFRDTENKDTFESLKLLVQEIESEEPYDDMPDEVKPSLVRLSKLTEQSYEESDKHILSPITSVLTKYVELKAEQDKLKKQTTRAYVLTIVSFVIGAISFYFTLSSPSAKDIAKEIRNVTTNQPIEHNQSTNVDVVNGSGS